MLVDDEFDIEECRHAMQAYCRDVVLIKNPYGRDGFAKRSLQLRSLRLVVASSGFALRCRRCSRRSTRSCAASGSTSSIWSSPSRPLRPASVAARHETSRADRRFPQDRLRPRPAVRGHRRQLCAPRSTPTPTGVNCGARRSETYRDADGVYLCSAADEQSPAPSMRLVSGPRLFRTRRMSSSIRPRQSDPASDGRTLVFFGLLSTCRMSTA